MATAQVEQQEAQQNNALDYLESLTTEELELICVERGFELVHDENEPGELTHADYVEAARRCLAIEEDMYVLYCVCLCVYRVFWKKCLYAELELAFVLLIVSFTFLFFVRNDILEQNPELAEELLSEIDRMKEEKERLEEARQEMLKQKEELEQQLVLQQASEATKSSTSATHTGTGIWGGSGSGSDTASDASSKTGGTAFVPHTSASTKEDDATATVTGPTSSTSGNNATAPTTTMTEQDATEEQDDDCNPTATATATDTDEVTITDTDEEATESSTTSDAATDNAVESTPQNQQHATTDFSIKGFMTEMMSEFQKDVHRITTIIFPIIQPMFQAGNKAWKAGHKAWGYLKQVYHYAKGHVEKYRSQRPEQSQAQQQQQEQSSSGVSTTTAR